MGIHGSVRPLAARDACACDAIIAGLSEWFGVEAGVAACAAAVRNQPGHVVEFGDQVRGFMTLARPFPSVAEITWMAVHADDRGKGLGRQLMETVAGLLSAAGVRYLVVKTVSSVAADQHYAETRAFYCSVGFEPLLELPDLWDADNPCVVLVRRLYCA